MTTQETIKPLVDRILSNPLSFRPGSTKDSTQEPSSQSSMLEGGSGPYVVIGQKKKKKKKNTVVTADAEINPGKVSKKRVKKIVPKSLAEAIEVYTKNGVLNSEPSVTLSDTDYQNDHSLSSSDEGEEIFHEAKEYIDDSDSSRTSSALPTNTTTTTPTTTTNITSSSISEESSVSSDDADFTAQGNMDSTQTSDSNHDISDISDSEKLELQKETLEHAQHEAKTLPLDDDANPKEALSLGDETEKFYQFNADINDTGSVQNSSIIKNWGPALTQLRPKGLLNHGVTCYTNAAVQAMIHIPAIQHYLFDIIRGKHNDKISPESVSAVLAETSKKMWLPNNNKTAFINPKKLITKLDSINCMMSEWQQEDSHEYFMSLMSRLQEDSVPPGHKMTESIIYDIFGGLLKQKVACKSCGGVSTTEQPFYDLSLHLKGKKTTKSKNMAMITGRSNDAADSKQDSSQVQDTSNNASMETSFSNGPTPQTSSTTENTNGEIVSRRFSIEKSIRDFFNPELIKVDDEMKGYVCEKCHQTTNAVKRNSILRAPETLLVHLKKFRFNGTSSSKMKQAVSYPMFLDLTEYCEVSKDTVELPVKYQLISVVVHEGRSLSSGHYVAHCKQPDGSWATYDDEYINKISETAVLKEPNAYYLLYTRLTPRAIKLRDLSLKPTDIDVPVANQQASMKKQSAQSAKHSSSVSNSNYKNKKKWKKNKKKLRK